jgi:hypothetical protein
MSIRWRIWRSWKQRYENDGNTRHCERSEAIQSVANTALDCFATLAMTIPSQVDELRYLSQPGREFQPRTVTGSPARFTEIRSISPSRRV